MASLPGSDQRAPDMVINPPHFERLPLAILHHVLLAFGSTSEQKALIRASPVIYRYYLQRPTFWLYRCLKCELGLGILDACSVHLSNAADFRPSRTKEKVPQFLETYDVQRREHYKAKPIPLDKYQIIPAVTFHSKIVKPLAYRFATWAQRHHDTLISPTQLRVLT